jgi:hypothetical protein
MFHFELFDAHAPAEQFSKRTDTILAGVSSAHDRYFRMQYVQVSAQVRQLTQAQLEYVTESTNSLLFKVFVFVFFTWFSSRPRFRTRFLSRGKSRFDFVLASQPHVVVVRV